MEKAKLVTLGYVRVSTEEQCLDRQISAIKKFRPEIRDCNIFHDEETGKTFTRDGLLAMKAIILNLKQNFGDDIIIEVIFKEVDRIGRVHDGILDEIKWLKEQGIVIRILEVPTTLIDVDENNKWILEILNGFIIDFLACQAQKENEKREQRQREAYAELKRKGVKMGRPEIKIDKFMFKAVAGQAVQGVISHSEAMRRLNIKRNTYYKHLSLMFPDYEKKQMIGGANRCLE